MADPSEFAYVPAGATRAFGQKPVRSWSGVLSPQERQRVMGEAMKQQAPQTNAAVSPTDDNPS